MFAVDELALDYPRQTARLVLCGLRPFPSFHPAKLVVSVEDDIFGPADVRQMRSQLLELRGDLDGFDLVIGGQRRRADWEAERDHIAAIAEAGATWWCEWVPPSTPDQMRRSVAYGPLR